VATTTNRCDDHSFQRLDCQRGRRGGHKDYDMAPTEKISMDDEECEPRAINGHGGKRPGRPSGSKNQRSAEIAQQAIEAGITPIEVMLTAMRDFWAEGAPEARREAAVIARHAAPYIHPRVANIDQTIHERQQFVVYAPEQCASAEEWEAEVRADGYGLTGKLRR
jgi:hypothetical protein